MLRLLLLVLYLMAAASTLPQVKPDSTPPNPANDIGGGLDPNG